MSKFSLTQTNPESDIFRHTGGVLTIILNGVFDGASVKFLVRANGVGFVEATEDDFNITTNDIKNVRFNSNIEYKLLISNPTVTSNVEVAII